MWLSRRSLLSAWSLGIVILAAYSQMSDNSNNPPVKHGSIATSGSLQWDNVLSPAPEIPADDLAQATAPTRYDIPQSAPTRYPQHQVEIWNGSKRDVVTLSESTATQW